jgi:hypothetical protein
MLKLCLYLSILSGIITSTQASEKIILLESTDKEINVLESDFQKLEIQMSKEKQLAALLDDFFRTGFAEDASVQGPDLQEPEEQKTKMEQLVDLVRYYFSTDFMETMDIPGFNFQQPETQSEEEQPMEVRLVRCLRKGFLDCDAKTGTALAILDLIKKECYFPATFEENEWLINGIHVHLSYSISKDKLAECIKTGNWSILNAVHSYKEVAERTHL